MERGTKNPATPPHPRPLEKTQVSLSDLDAARDRASHSLCAPRSFSFYPPADARPSSRLPQLPDSPRLSRRCRHALHFLALAIHLCSALIIPNINGSTRSPARRSSPICDGRTRQHLPGQGGPPSPSSAIKPAEQYRPRLHLPSVCSVSPSARLAFS